MLLVRDVEAATQFYGPGGIGLPVIVASRHWAELSFTHTTAPADFPVLALKLVDGYVASGADAARVAHTDRLAGSRSQPQGTHHS